MASAAALTLRTRAAGSSALWLLRGETPGSPGDGNRSPCEFYIQGRSVELGTRGGGLSPVTWHVVGGAVKRVVVENECLLVDSYSRYLVPLGLCGSLRIWRRLSSKNLVESFSRYSGLGFFFFPILTFETGSHCEVCRLRAGILGLMRPC